MSGNDNRYYKAEMTILDKARIQAHNYADDNEDEVVMLRQDEGASVHSILKNAYEQGYLDGFLLRLSEGDVWLKGKNNE